MAGAIDLAIVFLAGAFGEFALQTHRGGGRRGLKMAGLAPAIWLVASILATIEQGFVSAGGLVLTGAVAIGVVAILLRDDLLPEASELTLVLLTPLFWFVLVAGRSWGDPLVSVALAVGSAPTLGVVLLAATRWEPPFWTRVVATLWFLAVVVTLLLTRFPWSILGAIATGDGPAVAWWEVLVGGMLFSFLVVHGWYLLWTVRPPGRGESWDEYKREWREHVEALGRSFSPEQAAPLQAVGVLVGVTVLLAVVWWVPWLPSGSLVDVLVVGGMPALRWWGGRS